MATSNRCCLSEEKFSNEKASHEKSKSLLESHAEEIVRLQKDLQDRIRSIKELEVVSKSAIGSLEAEEARLRDEIDQLKAQQDHLEKQASDALQKY